MGATAAYDPIVDLHVHTRISDGSLTPAEIAEQAALHGVGVLAISDHDYFAGNIEAEPLLRARGIVPVRAVEIDCLEGDRLWHVLGYGVDFDDPAFAAFVAHTRAELDRMSDVLIEKLARAGYDVSQAELDAFEDDRSLGGWKALHYFLHKRITSVLKQGVLLYARHGVLYDRFDYFDVRETCAAIRGAGGYAVLAHPGEMIEPPTPYDLERALVRLRGCGLDGIECYYPTHTRDITDCCLRFCARHDMMITAGSDCHGAFGRARVGEMDIRLSRLNLRDLLERRQEEQ